MSKSTQCLEFVVPLAVFLYFVLLCISIFLCSVFVRTLRCVCCSPSLNLAKVPAPLPGRLPKHSSAKRCYDDEDYYKNNDDDNYEDYKNDDENTKGCF